MIQDSEFFRMEGVPITKEEIRAVSIGKLNLDPEDVVLDIGCGSGGMSVEISKRSKFVYSIDNSEDAKNTTLNNLKKFNVENCTVSLGNAEDLISKFDFNKVFIGGTQNIEQILEILKEKNIERIVVNTIVLENSVKIINKFEELGYNVDFVNVSVSYGKKINSGHIMLSKNPITIITATLK
ncbi:precorrin-6Y C5,15-methyltransferase (decarboxylating) subunit CbiT [Methanococcus maripaludis]|uniref:Probable cobalt-precorrin-6B C(15)-methyltransferase (decarboxylating) n=4 Tax=Methanococcus maripaludis TaxID=39152 RepID=CBIT_METMP|nr:precorrin-6Y C5,15-methyltransferase (decarboxylating) subunit CbiT [Methanococcus maripaludis]P61820.1 RecName: Full=Probable cobalt-precorrin-6B C(15)-methyltransferase (decarboxylating) [Methanococcus maripaludis S2]MBA2850376.1 cobalt-precorrin-6B (C15)-methyltransferase [Methanococcus maripaludis]MBG0768820.1 precorrin-6Y C5,15-methyltransferase (decarboxylating) subunit CbiT [Methanococcus maripaludis]MBM7409259.1 cobalt-precorrin-6B (C15)-methyltransferase [Methanococcus maripaludis]